MSERINHRAGEINYFNEDRELEQSIEQVWDIAIDNGLDPFPTHFEIAPADIVYQVGAYGVPGRFSHWTSGRQFRSMKTTYDHGLSKIYELVINSNPAQAYLLENNLNIDNTFVAAHVLGHTDFFKNNHTFANTRRDMPEAAARSAARIESYEEVHGRLEVETFLDATLALEHHVDPYLIMRPDRAEELSIWQQKTSEINRPKPELRDNFDELFGPRAATVEQDLGRRALVMMPPEPDSDLLGFIRNHAPYLDDWQRDVVDIVREQSLYFYPQRRTKIMNEGWAAYWHKRIMREMSDRGNISDADNEHWWKLHSGIVAPNPRQLNPYYLGMKMYEYIEDYYNGTLSERETNYLKRQGVTTYPEYTGPLKNSPAMPHLRDAMMHNDDQSFIRNYFNKIISDRMDLYIYDEKVDPKTGETTAVIVENGWEQIRDKLVEVRDNNGVPRIVVKNGDYRNAGELYLYHEFDGRTLDPSYVEKTLPYIYQLWGRPVYIESRTEEEEVLTYRYDEAGMTTQSAK